MTMTPEQKKAVDQAGDTPVLVEDPETHAAYLLIREDVYQRMQALAVATDGPLSIEEQKAVLRLVFGLIHLASGLLYLAIVIAVVLFVVGLVRRLLKV